LFNYSSYIFEQEKNTEFIILTDKDILLGIYQNESFNIQLIEDVDNMEMNLADDKNAVAKTFDLDFSENISEITKFIRTRIS